MKVILTTGGAGFIGSNFIKFFLRRNKSYILVNLDKLTYAGNLKNLSEVETSPRYHFIKGDICNQDLVNYIMKRYRPDCVINFAAETQADRSFEHPLQFTQSNVLGTLTLLESARYVWNRNPSAGSRFIQVSTDEVYGSNLNPEEYFTEDSPPMPDNPFAASKAGAELLVRSYCRSHDLPALITRCCSTYGPCQNREKFIPSCIAHALRDEPLPLRSEGTGTREWLHVQDLCIAIIRAMFYGKPGEIYNIGSGDTVSDLTLAKRILGLLGKQENLLTLQKDRAGTAKRCALNSYKARSNLSWTHRYGLDEGLRDTVLWYRNNKEWLGIEE